MNLYNDNVYVWRGFNLLQDIRGGVKIVSPHRQHKTWYQGQHTAQCPKHWPWNPPPHIGHTCGLYGWWTLEGWTQSHNGMVPALCQIEGRTIFATRGVRAQKMTVLTMLLDPMHGFNVGYLRENFPQISFVEAAARQVVRERRIGRYLEYPQILDGEEPPVVKRISERRLYQI